MKNKLRSYLLPLLVFLLPFNVINAEENQDSYAQHFAFGDWGGTRTSLADDGIEFEFIYTADYYNLDYFDSNTNQQETKSIYLDNVDITMTIDAEKSMGLTGATFFMYVLGNNGDNPSGDYVEDIQGFSNIESPDTWKIYEFWYQQNFANDSLSLLFGLYDLNSEFDVIETAGLFSSSSHGIGPDFSQSGENGPSIFPTTSVSLRLLYNITEQTYLQAVVMDGVPGDPNDPKGTHIKFDSTDGLLSTVEFGTVSGDNVPYHKVAVGFWAYSKAIVGNDRKNKGTYLLGEMQVFQESGDASQGLNIFARYGVAEDVINDIGTYTGAGLVYTGLFPGRDLDQFGLAIAIADPTDQFEKDNANISEAETAIELTYLFRITPWFALKPDVQWIKNPGMVTNKDDATVVGARLELSF